MAEIDVCPLEELPPGRTKIVREGLLAVCVYNLGGELYALEDRCSHDDGPLCGTARTSTFVPATRSPCRPSSRSRPIRFASTTG